MSYSEAKAFYAARGVDTDKAIETMKNIPISIHCWQGDDVLGFDGADSLDGGIQTTGNYPGRASTPEELMADFDKVLELTPGLKKLNLHANYAIWPEGETPDRSKLEPRHFAPWVEYAKSRGIGLDFNPTMFSDPHMKDGLSLTSPDEETRQFWVRHCQCCVKISEYFANELGQPCLMNIWIPDGMKDWPADRLGPRARYKKSLDEILSIPYDKTKVFVTVESKTFGIGFEAYTAGSAEFTLNYANYAHITPLMDNGHYHPTEMVSDKIASQLLFHDHLALHITRPMRWDSDHVVLFDDETREIAKEVVRCGGLDKVFLATDWFDASINRVSAWVTGLRAIHKSFLNALCEPYAHLKELQDNGQFTRLMAEMEDLRCAPFYDVWLEYLRQTGVPENYIDVVEQYEADVMLKR